MQICFTCKIQKTDIEFYADNRSGKLHGRCIKCMNKYNNNFYSKNKLSVKKKIEERKKTGKYFVRKFKKCPTCKKTLSHKEFSLNICNYDKLSAYCKICVNINTKKRPSYNSYNHKKKNAIDRFENKLKLIKKLGRVCNNCGDSNILHLQFDHVNDDGNIHRKKRKSTSFTPRELKDIYNNGCDFELQLLCANCNFAKRLLRDRFFSELYKEYSKNA